MSDGSTNTGEAVPVKYVTGESEESVQQAVLFANELLSNRDAYRWLNNLQLLRAELPSDFSAVAAIEMAYFNWLAEQANVPLWKYFGGVTDRIETDITLSISSDAPLRAREAKDNGFQIIKMKVGSRLVAEDLDRLISIDKQAPNLIYRVDANQGYSVSDALKFVEGALKAGIVLQLIEQPVLKEDLAGLDQVARNSPIPVFADESVKTTGDALTILTQTAVQGINVKIMKSGITGALEIISIAKVAKRKLMVGCMLESRAGIASSLALACGTGAFDYVDLDSHMLLAETEENEYFRQDGSNIGYW